MSDDITQEARAVLGQIATAEGYLKRMRTRMETILKAPPKSPDDARSILDDYKRTLDRFNTEARSDRQ